MVGSVVSRSTLVIVLLVQGHPLEQKSKQVVSNGWLDHGYQGAHTPDGIHPQELYPPHQGRQVQQRVRRLHQIANDHECTTKPPFQSIHSRVSLILDSPGAKRNRM
jgi:hypothetical protein